MKEWLAMAGHGWPSKFKPESDSCKFHANKLNRPSAEQDESQHELLDVVEKALMNAMQTTWQVVAGMKNIESKISCDICEATCS